MPIQDNTQVPATTTFHQYDFLHAHAHQSMARDKTQSTRLHEPTSRMTLTDPITGEDITEAQTHPFLEDGNLTIYFATEASRKSYIEIPLNHPALRLPYPASAEDDRGG